MIKLSIPVLVTIYMLISPFLNLKDQLNFGHLEETSFTTLIFDHEIEVAKKASFLEMQAAKILAVYRSHEYSANLTKHN